MRTNKKTTRERFAITDKRWELYAKLITTGVDTAVKFAKTPAIGPLLKKIVYLDKPEKNHTQGYVIDINVDLNETDQNVVLPIHMMQMAIEKSNFRSIMNKCLCRTGHKCHNYDIDLGCIFIGNGARSTVENGIAREVTVDEALKHVDRAMGQGLVGQCLWVEAEKFVWGINDNDLHKFLEICFCCPCCCLALRNRKRMTPDIKTRFRTVGWKSTYKNGCDGCGICESNCPTRAIKIENNSVFISNQCFGCGICAFKCPQKALEMKTMYPQKQSIQDYFQGFGPDI